MAEISTEKSSKDEISEDDSSEEESSKDEILKVQEIFHFLYLTKRVNAILRRENDLSDEDIQEKKDELRRNFHYSEGGRWYKNDWNNPSTLCAYLSRYSTYSAASMRYRTLQALEYCEQFRSILDDVTDLRVVSVGGGPGFELAGFLSALYNYYKGSGFETLHMCVVDSVGGWKQFYHYLLDELQNKNYGDASAMFERKTITSEFLHHDASKSSDVFTTLLKSADIVIMKGLLSIVQRSEIDDIQKEVVSGMKSKALLFHNDINQYSFEEYGLRKLRLQPFGPVFMKDYDIIPERCSLTDDFRGMLTSSKAVLQIFERLSPKELRKKEKLKQKELAKRNLKSIKKTKSS